MANGIVDSNLMKTVFLIKSKNGIGTAFTIYKDNQEYIVTAKHITKNSDDIYIFCNNTWINLGKNIRESLIADIAVIKAPIRLVNDITPLELNNDGIIYSQDVYFLGFPYGMFNDAGDILGGRPLAFIKKGILSAIHSKREGMGTIFFIDGHNNKGFSGGPVVFKNIDNNKWSICSVISGYYSPNESILDMNNNKTDFIYKENSGIIISYGVNHINELIEKWN